MPIDPIISTRARAIARGLIHTHRAFDDRIVHGHLQLRAADHNGGFYWIAADGSRLLRGHELGDAEELQPSFVEAMIQAADAMSRKGKAKR
jgi:hypothetical protein